MVNSGAHPGSYVGLLPVKSNFRLGLTLKNVKITSLNNNIQKFEA